MKNFRFPHEFDELAKKNTHAIEDDFKLSAELGSSITDKLEPHEKWKLYKKFVGWVSFCDRMKIPITNRDIVYLLMKKLWDDVKASSLYKKRGAG